ncbi:MAG: hypothetical protein P4L82_15025 [Ancalomicrobiaceae bacterium]|nr:hypothetical protein [Ancalomicrobiaceae bacterium]
MDKFSRDALSPLQANTPAGIEQRARDPAGVAGKLAVRIDRINL